VSEEKHFYRSQWSTVESNLRCYCYYSVSMHDLGFHDNLMSAAKSQP